MFVYHRRDNMRHLETQSQKGFYMGPGSGPSMDRVFLKNGGTGAVKQFRLVLVPPAFAQQNAMRSHLAAEHYPPAAYERGIHEEERMGTVFAVAIRDVGEHDEYADEPFMEELAGLDTLTAFVPHRPTPRVRPWQCGVTTSRGIVVNILHWATGTMTCCTPRTITTYLLCHLARNRRRRNGIVLC